MAISLVAVSAATDTGTAATAAKPTGAAEGDVLLAFVHADADLTIVDNNGGTPMTPAIDVLAYQSGAASLRIFSRVLGASEPSDYAFTLGASQDWAVSLRCYRGVHADVYDVAPASGTNSAEGVSDTGSAPGITTTTDDAMGIAVVVVDSGSSAATHVTGGPDESYTNASLSAGRCLATYDKALGAAGAQNSVEWELNPGTPTWAAFQFALKAAVGGGATLDQFGYRFYEDDAGEGENTPLEAENTPATLERGVPFRLRIGVDATGDPDAKSMQLEYRRVGDTTWRKVE